MIRFAGDFASLQRFERKIAKLPSMVVVVSRNLAEESVDLVKQGFVNQEDPYGARWKPKAIDDGRAVLTGATGQLKNGWHVATVSADGFKIAPTVSYARFHQSGTGIFGPSGGRIRPKKAKALRLGSSGLFARSVKGVPQRKMIPDRGQLPPVWRRHLVTVAQEVLTETFG